MKHLTFVSAILMIPAMATGGPLHDAARQGDTAGIEALVNDGADVNEVQMVTPLVMAALSGQSEAVALLLTRGADPDIETSAMGTALHAAAQRGFQEVARVLLDAGAGTETRNSDGYTPLMIAALNNKTTVLGLLIEEGADIHATGVARGNGMGGNGRVSALHVAAFDGETEAAGLLRSAGAGPLPIAFPASGLEGADIDLGRDLTHQWCRSCHLLEADGTLIDKPANGPPLTGVFGRPVASVPGFGYTAALRQMGGAWTAERLYSYASEAMLTAPGTRMRWNDGWTADDVLHIVAYLASDGN